MSRGEAAVETGFGTSHVLGDGLAAMVLWREPAPISLTVTAVMMYIKVKSMALGYQDAKHRTMRQIHIGMFKTDANSPTK